MLDFLRFYRLLLDDPSATVRQIAATGVRPYEDETLVEPLTKLANADPDSEVRIAAVEALGAFIMQAEFGMMDAKAVKAVTRVLATIMADHAAPQRLRAAALVALAVRGDDRQVHQGIAAFHESGEPDLHHGAIQAMGRSGADRWLPLLEAALRSADPDVRQAAAASLANYEADAVPMLTMVVREDQEAPVRLEAIQSLGTIGGRKALESLTTLREYVSDDEIEAVDVAMGEAEAMIGLEAFDEDDEYALDDDGEA
jgi:HEAT repeat protein